MTPTTVAGLDIDLIDICIDKLRDGQVIQLLECNDTDELKRYLNDEDVMTTIKTINDKIIITPVFILN